MPARLFCEIGELAGSDFLIDQEATIGRIQQNEITLHPTFISGHHARIYFDDEENEYVLEDLGSSNGTMLDGMAVTEPMLLDRLHVITFAGQFDFIFQKVSEAFARRIDAGAASPSAPRDEGEKTRMGDAFLPLPPLADEKTADEMEKTHVGAFFGDLPPLPEQQDPREKTRIEDAFPVTPPLVAAATDSGDDEAVTSTEPADQPGSFELAVTMPDGTRQVFMLEEGSNVVGRESTRAIALPDPSISRDHALVTVRGDQVLLKDLGSKNATFVDGRKLTDEGEILPESAISFGLEITARLRRRE